jgi:hypothetical protein
MISAGQTRGLSPIGSPARIALPEFPSGKPGLMASFIIHPEKGPNEMSGGEPKFAVAPSS